MRDRIVEKENMSGIRLVQIRHLDENDYLQQEAS